MDDNPDGRLGQFRFPAGLIVLVELPHAGNIRMLGNLLGPPLQDVIVGARVEACFEHHEGDEPYTLLQWRYPAP